MAKILIVDDVADNVKLLSYDLADEGYETITAFRGAQALELAKKERPDLVLLDIMMPEMDGIEVCRRMKADPDLRAIPVIMVSAKGESDAIIEGLSVGAHDYIAKPFEWPIVAARVASALRIKKAHDTIIEMNANLEMAKLQAEAATREKSVFWPA